MSASISRLSPHRLHDQVHAAPDRFQATKREACLTVGRVSHNTTRHSLMLFHSRFGSVSCQTSVNALTGGYWLSFSRLAFVGQTPSSVTLPGMMHRCITAPQSPHVIANRYAALAPWAGFGRCKTHPPHPL